MNYYTIKELHELLLQGKITPTEIITTAFQALESYHDLNATVTILKTEALKVAKELEALEIKPDDYLFAIPYFAKDNFATKNIRTTASSHILDNFIPPYDAQVVKILANNNAILLGKTALDELGMGGHGLYAHTGEVLNPWDKTRITGGSSSGSAALVAAGVVPFALGSDTGDSIRKPASYTGIVGLKPTYGILSRFGLFPYAPSLDTVGYFTRTVEDCAIVLDYLAKQDDKDATSLPSDQQNYYQNLTTDIKNYQFAYIKQIHQQLPAPIKAIYEELYQKLTVHNIRLTAIEFPEDLLKALLPVYMIISFAEAVSSHSNLDGINFGVRQEGETYEEVMLNSRGKGFGDVVKRRYVIGSYALTRKNQTLLFLKAKRVRRLIVTELEKIFSQYDILLLPSASDVAPKIADIKQQVLKEEDVEHYIDDVLVLANFMGNPSLTIPLALINELPIGININAKPFNDQAVLNVGYLLEDIIGLKNLVVPARKRGVK